MKKVLLISLLATVFFTDVTEAQEIPQNVVSIAPLWMLPKIRLNYTREINGYLALGEIATYYNSWLAYFPGIKSETYIRVYFTGKGPGGFYLQGSFNYGMNKYIDVQITDSSIYYDN